MITQSAKLNLIPGAVLPRINVSQYDKGSRTLEFPIYDGEQRFTLTSSMSASIHGTKPDGNGFAYAGTVNTTDNIVELDVVQQMTAVSGEVVCEVIITKSGKRIGTVNFILNVQPAALNDNTVISDSDLSIVEEALEFAEDIPGYRTEFEGYVEDSEAWAKGTRNGIAVPSTDPTYHNNSKYYANRYTELTSAITTMTNDLGAKNLLPYPYYDTNGTTSQGFTFVVNDDGSIYLNGSYGSGTRPSFNLARPMLLKAGTYVISKGSTSSGALIRVIDAVNTSTVYGSASNTTSYDEFTLSQDTNVFVQVLVNNNSSVDFTIYPMICYASVFALDDTYVPYAKTNKQLTEDSVSWEDMSQIGAVNFLPCLYDSEVVNGITFTANNDGTVTAAGTINTASATHNYVKSADNYYLPAGTYKLCGCPTGGGNNTYNIRVYNINSSSVKIAQDNGSGATFTLASDTKISVACYVIYDSSDPQTVNILFKPMITPVDYNGDYVPYAKSNKELTADVATVTESAAQGVSAYGGTLAVTHIGVTANVATQIISKRGVYLVLFTIYDVASAAYLINVDSSDSSKCFATELAAPPSGVTITFDFSTAGKVKVTADHGYRVRVITIADANY